MKQKKKEKKIVNRPSQADLPSLHIALSLAFREMFRSIETRARDAMADDSRVRHGDFRPDAEINDARM